MLYVGKIKVDWINGIIIISIYFYVMVRKSDVRESNLHLEDSSRDAYGRGRGRGRGRGSGVGGCGHFSY